MALNHLRVWKTASKDTIPVEELKDSHLVNILKMLEEEAEGKRRPLSHLAQYPVLIKEAARRGVLGAEWVESCES